MPITQVRSAPHRPDPHSWLDTELTVAWLGHATVLINIRGSLVLTDPALERRIGIGHGFTKLGPRRLIEPALHPRELPPLDLILLSHAHMAPPARGTRRRLPATTRVVLQDGNRDLVRRFKRVDELG